MIVILVKYLFWYDWVQDESDHNVVSPGRRARGCTSLVQSTALLFYIHHSLHVSCRKKYYSIKNNKNSANLRMSFNCLNSPLRQSPSFTSCMFCSFSCPTSESSWAILSSFRILKKLVLKVQYPEKVEFWTILFGGVLNETRPPKNPGNQFIQLFHIHSFLGLKLSHSLTRKKYCNRPLWWGSS